MEPEPLLELALDELAGSLEDIRELARGLHPRGRAERGLGAAREALVLRTPVRVARDAVPAQRPAQVEATAYYVVAEALANVQKHARAGRVGVRVTGDARHTDVTVVDDGVGGADVTGAGLRGLADRVEARGGRLDVESPRGAGTWLRAQIPHDAMPDLGEDRPVRATPPSPPGG